MDKMTREEAIADIRDNIKPVVGGKSLDMAIEALEQEPCTDAINRQAVLEILNNAYFLKLDDGAALQESVNQLPPVTPAEKQEPREDVSDINDGNIYECPCGYGWDKSKVVRHHFCPNCGRAVDSTEQEPCDAVSRKEVMNMLHNHAFDYATSTKILALLKTMCGEVDRMPSVTPQYTEAEIQKMQELEQAEIQKAYELGKAEQPKMGRWIRVDKDKCKCDQCEVISFIAMYPNGDKNYCPNCGAKMEDVKNEQKGK